MQKHEETSRVRHVHVNDLHGGRVKILGDGVRHPLAGSSPDAGWHGVRAVPSLLPTSGKCRKPGVNVCGTATIVLTLLNRSEIPMSCRGV